MEFFLPVVLMFFAAIAGVLSGLYLLAQWLVSLRQKRIPRNRLWLHLWANGWLSLTIGLLTGFHAHTSEFYLIAAAILCYACPILWLIALYHFHAARGSG